MDLFVLVGLATLAISKLLAFVQLTIQLSQRRCPATTDVHLVNHYEAIINQFLAVDSTVNHGRAAWLWPKLLGMCYPALACKNLVQMLLCLVFRGLRNQGGNGLKLDFVEIFAGKAWLSHQMLAGGFHGCAFDYVFSQAHDALTSAGLRLYLDAVSCVRPKKGLVWLATQCSSFTVLCRHQSQRMPENQFLGVAGGYAFVHTGNHLAEISSLIYFLCYLLSVWVALEQPLSSCMMETPSLVGVLLFSHSIRVQTYMGAFQGPTVKPLQIRTTWAALGALEREKPWMEQAESLVTRSASGFTGRKALLHESQVYTKCFGKAICDICRREWQSL